MKNLLSEFRPLLSPKTKFYWNDAMTKKFQEVTNSLVEQAKDGVMQFNMDRWMILETDFSKD